MSQSLRNTLSDENIGLSLELENMLGRTYRTYGMLLKILPSALYTRHLSVQALQSRLCLSYVSYATTAA
jgi:hypothetical protein